jgi:tetratricopeptide (TPR) repeat protein
VIANINFPKPKDGALVQVVYPFTFHPTGGQPITPSSPPTIATMPAMPDPPKPRDKPATDLASVMTAIARGRVTDAYAMAKRWRDEAPGDVLALIALGEVLEARKDFAEAARIYGSIIDLYPTRADFRRFAGERLERVTDKLDVAQARVTRRLVIDSYRKAVADRPDHATGHRLLAYALLRDADYAGAFAAILAGIDQKYPAGRFLAVERVFGEDAGLIGAAYAARGGAAEVKSELAKRSLAIATRPSTRFVLYWETDANDVDFHIKDANGYHAWYQNKTLASGGELYADITTGYGPECFTIPGKPSAGPYTLSLQYYSQGPMGYGMGLLQIQRFDGKGTMTFEDRPYVITTNQEFVELGTAK